MSDRSSTHRRPDRVFLPPRVIVLCLLILLLLPPYASGQDHTAALDSLVARYRSLGWSGVLCAGAGGRETYVRAFGLADREQGKPMITETRFKTESVGKMFTAVRIMQLVAARKLSFATTLADVLPDWHIPHADRITVAHLLTHTSGLSSPWDHPDYVFGRIYSREEMKRIIETAPVIFDTPGEKTYYSNSGYILLGEMIEKCDRMPFETSIKRHVFRPAGMKETRSLNDSVLPADAARPYYQVTRELYAPDDTRYGDGKANGAGGWMSTAGDLFRFARAYLDGRLLSRQWMNVQMTNNSTADSTSTANRYGFSVLKTGPPHAFIVGHNGGGKGFSADVFFEPATGDIVVFCSNLYGTGYTLTGRVFRILNGEPYETPVASGPVRLAEWVMNQSDTTRITDEVLQGLGITDHSEFLFFTVFDNLTSVGMHAAASEVIAACRQRYPGNPYAWVKSGENAEALGRTAEADGYYREALSIALASKDDALEAIINKRLSKSER